MHAYGKTGDRVAVRQNAVQALKPSRHYGAEARPAWVDIGPSQLAHVANHPGQFNMRSGSVNTTLIGQLRCAAARAA
jgi:hypothetical protein